MSHPNVFSSQIQELAIVVTVDEGIPPLKIEMQANATANLKTPSMYPFNWYPAKLYQFSRRSSTHETQASAITSRPSMPECNCVCGMIKTPGRRSIALETVSCGSTVPSNPNLGGIPLSKKPKLHSLPREKTACGTPDMFQMDELDLPSSRDSQFRSPVIVDTGLDPGNQAREPSTTMGQATKVRQMAM